MGEALVSQEALTEKIAFMRTILDERQYRLYLASEANALGRGGMSLVSKASGASMVTIRKGLEEMRRGDAWGEAGRQRHMGGGRKGIESVYPRLMDSVLEILDTSDGRGEIGCALTWTTYGLKEICKILEKEYSIKLSHTSLRKTLKGHGFDIGSNRRMIPGGGQDDIGKQFGYINAVCQRQFFHGCPVVYMNFVKKKDLIARIGNDERWRDKNGDEIIRDFGRKENIDGATMSFNMIKRARSVEEFVSEAAKNWWREGAGYRDYHDRDLFFMVHSGCCGGMDKFTVRDLSLSIGVDTAVSYLPPGTYKWRCETEMEWIYYREKGSNADDEIIAIRLIAPRDEKETVGEGSEISLVSSGWNIFAKKTQHLT